jgi:hypothetical protein
MVEPGRSRSIIAVFATDNEGIVLASDIDVAAVRTDRHPLGSAVDQMYADIVGRRDRPSSNAIKSGADIPTVYLSTLEFDLIIYLRGKVGRLRNDSELTMQV